MFECLVMAKDAIDDEIEEVILQALGHEVRRGILRIIDGRERGASYTGLMVRLKLSTGKLNYHLKQLEGFVEKNKEQEYILTPLGRKALDLLISVSQGLDLDYKKFAETAYRAQKRSLQPLTRSFIFIVLIGDFMASVMTGWLAYVAFSSGGPALAKTVLPLAFSVEIAFLAWLIYVLKAVPDRVKRFERRVFGSR